MFVVVIGLLVSIFVICITCRFFLTARVREAVDGKETTAKEKNGSDAGDTDGGGTEVDDGSETDVDDENPLPAVSTPLLRSTRKGTAASSAAASTAATPEACVDCTFMNKPGALECLMCGLKTGLPRRSTRGATKRA